LLSLVEGAIKEGARKKNACSILGVNVRNIERWRNAVTLNDKRTDRIFIPPNKLSEAEITEVLNISNSKRFCDIPPSQIVPILADEGIYIASESTFYRVLKKEGLLTHREKSQPRQNKKPRELMAINSNQVWSWDITYLPSRVRGLFFYLYMVVDIYSRKIVGWEVSDRETSHIGSNCIIRACLEEKIGKDHLSLHSDNGSPMKGATLLATLERLGVISSYSRPSVSNDNPYSESLFKTMKYNRFYPSQPFKDIDDATQWVVHFIAWYNNEHRHSALQFVTPHQKHTGEDRRLLAARTRIYELARLEHPSRWATGIRNWTPINIVFLNPDRKAAKQIDSLVMNDSYHKKRQLA
jgi:putative transposase